MSSTQLRRLAAVLAVVLVLWGAVALASRRSESKSDAQAVIPRVDTSRVDTVSLVGPADTAILIRTTGGSSKWQVNGFPADVEAVNELLKALVDTGMETELIARNPASHGRLRVTEDSGLRVRVIRQGSTVVDLIAGKQTADWNGVYLRRAGQPEVYAVQGDLARSLGKRGEEWRDHIVAKVTPDSIGAVEIKRGNRGYTLRRKGSAWVFGSGSSPDSAAVAGLLASYGSIRATGFPSKAQEDSLRFKKPRRTARVLDRKGAPLLSLAFDSIASGVWVRVLERKTGQTKQGGETYQLDSWTADQLTPPDSSLRKR